VRVPASICSVLLAATVLAQGLAPAPAAAEAANPGAGVCEALSGGVYWNFTTESFCEPGGGSGGGSPGGGGPGADIPKDHESSGETIFVQSQVEGGTYCGSFSDAFVDRAQDCLNRGVKVNCSPVDGCFKCPEEGCVAGRPPSRGQRPKGDARKKRSSPPRIITHEACRQLARDYRDVTHQYGDLDRFVLSLGFTWNELYGSVVAWEIASGPEKGGAIVQGPARTVPVPPSALPNRFHERWAESLSKQWFISQMLKRHSCGKYKDLNEVNELDSYYPTGYPSR
jgi:hypothetical protein